MDTHETLDDLITLTQDRLAEMLRKPHDANLKAIDAMRDVLAMLLYQRRMERQAHLEYEVYEDGNELST